MRVRSASYHALSDCFRLDFLCRALSFLQTDLTGLRQVRELLHEVPHLKLDFLTFGEQLRRWHIALSSRHIG